MGSNLLSRGPGGYLRNHTRATRVSCYTGYVTNLTITVDADTLKRARIRAIQRGESVNQVLARVLREYAGQSEEATRRRAAAERFVELSRALAGSSEGQGWTREELYEERLGSRS